MKILFIQLIGKGGTSLYTSQITNTISKNETDVRLVLGSHLYNNDQFEISKESIFTVNTSSNILFMALNMINPFIYIEIINYIIDEKPDIIHILFEDITSAIILYILRNRYIIVSTEHNISYHLGEKLIQKISFIISKFFIRRSTRMIIVHGTELKKSLIKKGVSNNKITVIPHGDYSYYKNISQTEYAEEENTILFFGAIREYKGLHYLLDAIKILKAKNTNVRLIIAGSGDISHYKDNLLELSESIELHNRYIEDKEVASFFQRSSIVVLPYIEASQSGVIPVAYAFKKPVISSNVGSIPEVIDSGKTGLLVPPKDSLKLAEAIEILLGDNILREIMGENANLKMEEVMSWDQIISKHITLYKDLAK